MVTRRIAIVGGGISGLTAAWQLARSRPDIDVHLFESSPRLGGTVETVHQDGFTVECGPDGWVTEKPWARDLAIELGIEADLLFSSDETRKTHILLGDRLETMPDGMRMMVPTDLDAIDRSHLFSPEAKRAYHDELSRAEELRMHAPSADESIATFTRRHFGQEVLARIATPLLSGVLGGDPELLSVQAVMPQFVAMEREHGSLIAALQARSSRTPKPIFTTLRSGLGDLIDRMVTGIPAPWLKLNIHVHAISHTPEGWMIDSGQESPAAPFDGVILALPPHAARTLVSPLDPQSAELLSMEATSAIVVAFAFGDVPLLLPPGFGFLVSPSSENQLLACTFVDQKFRSRVPPGGRLIRAFFGGQPAEKLLGRSDGELSALALRELTRIIGPLPSPSITVVRRWPKSLPQYAVGHLERMAELHGRIAQLPGLTLLGNAYRGVGLPDLIRDARSAVRTLVHG